MIRSPRIARSLPALTLALTLALVLPLGAGCQGWTMDYGKPAAQFEADDAVALAQEYLGEKVSVRGEVLSVDVSNPEDCVVELQGGVTARFGAWKDSAESCTVGTVVYVDGIVKAGSSLGVTLDPALGRDPEAPFEPKKP